MGCGLSRSHHRPEALVSHRNARTTFHGRLLIVQRYQAGWAKAHIAKAMGVSRKCVHTWVSRYETDGEAGLADRSSRPHCTPGRTPRSWPGGGVIDAVLTRSAPSSGYVPAPSRVYCADAVCLICVTATR